MSMSKDLRICNSCRLQDIPVGALYMIVCGQDGGDDDVRERVEDGGIKIGPDRKHISEEHHSKGHSYRIISGTCSACQSANNLSSKVSRQKEALVSAVQQIISGAGPVRLDEELESVALEIINAIQDTVGNCGQ